MLLEFSHIIAFSVLFINSLFDVFSEKGDVPSEFSVAAILGGILLHIGYAFQLGSLTPFIWLLGIGGLFTLYGWMAYWLGMWGGADALAMTVLGFAAPYSVSGPGTIYGFSLFVNIFLVSTVYAALFTVKKAIDSPKLRKAFINRLGNRKLRVGGALMIAAVISLTQQKSLYGIATFTFFSGLIMLYHLTKELESTELSKEIPVSQVEEGDVIDTDQLELGTRERNLIGKMYSKTNDAFNGKLSKTRLKLIDDKLGYSNIVGITEEQIKELENKKINKVKIIEGLRLIPVFPVALVVTETGFTVIYYLSLI